MQDLEQQLHRLMHHFVDQITQLAQRAALRTIRETMARAGTAPRRAGRSLRTGVRRRPGRPFGSGADKRTAAELDALAQRFTACVQEHPGLRVEQINHALGTSTRDLALPIRKLVASGAIRVEGRKRATTYYAAPVGSVH